MINLSLLKIIMCTEKVLKIEISIANSLNSPLKSRSAMQHSIETLVFILNHKA